MEQGPSVRGCISRDWQIHDQGKVGDKIISTRWQRSNWWLGTRISRNVEVGRSNDGDAVQKKRKKRVLKKKKKKKRRLFSLIFGGLPTLQLEPWFGPLLQGTPYNQSSYTEYCGSIV